MTAKEIASELKNKLSRNLPGIIKKVILYGSQVNGKVHESSDIDILVVIEGKIGFEIKDKIYDICYDENLKHNVWIDVNIISVGDLNKIRGKQPFIINALSYGIQL